MVGQPEAGLGRLVLAITDCCEDDDHGYDLDEDEEYGALVADFGGEIEMMVKAVDRTLCGDEEFIELVTNANKTLKGLEEYNLCGDPFGGTRKYLKGLQKSLDALESEDEEESNDS
ncbi:unnamed protein product [Ambrosiozyma monospora]|uniref:Unnamed protein product n=1 Tax=Ambrosiozyma monospora TaxID=43982 RepID=A0ACB5U2D5_AMBMO|nr:unnamed protein product [Ambrosiozyma monospora]